MLTENWKALPVIFLFNICDAIYKGSYEHGHELSVPGVARDVLINC
jgi:hypothetical protein